MRSVSVVGAAAVLGFSACGDASGAPKQPSPITRTANAILSAQRAQNAAAVCRLFPPDLVAYIGGTAACINVQRDNFAARRAPGNGGRIPAIGRLRPRAGAPVRVVDVRRQPRYRTSRFAHQGGIWVALVPCGRRVRTRPSDFAFLRPSEIREAHKLLARGTQCVTIARLPAGLHGTWDTLCENYAARRRPFTAST